MRTLTLAIAVLTLGACGTPPPPPTPSPSPTVNLATRPSSPVRIRIVSPADQAQIPAGVIHVGIAVDGGIIVKQTTTHITPTEGHVHFSVNGKLISMNYGTAQDVPLQKGLYILTAEFVAADHIPFNPRVTTSITVDVT
jgi:hypothetical protein